MYKLYKIINNVTSGVYFGITSVSLAQRWNSHRWAAKHGCKTKLGATIRKHGIENFTMVLIHDNLRKEEACNLEIKYISEYQGKIYNLAVGGQTGFSMHLKTEDEQLAWKSNLSRARAGRKPALGMKHTDENKEVFSTHGKARWDLYGRYPSEVLDYGFSEANRKFGISKTHYYRLRKASNERLGT